MIFCLGLERQTPQAARVVKAKASVKGRASRPSESTRWVLVEAFCSEIRGEQSRFCEFLDGLHYVNLEHLNSPMHLSSEIKCSTWITLYAWALPATRCTWTPYSSHHCMDIQRRLGIFRKSHSPQAISPHSPFRIKDQGNASGFFGWPNILFAHRRRMI